MTEPVKGREPEPDTSCHPRDRSVAGACPDCGAEIPDDLSSEANCPKCLIGFGLGAGAVEGTTGCPPGGPDSLPEYIGPYRILRSLGEGGMGVVYLAEQEDPVRRRVALKVLKAGMDTREVLARFDLERQALALMEHANIARVLDAGQTDRGRSYFVMEWVKGEPITTYCDRHGLSTRERLELFIPVCEAVQHAHHKGVIHRDLKPSNILVTVADGRPLPKVIDFGIAKATSLGQTARTLLTRKGEMIGTPEYMSPEQAEMSGLDVDTRTDVYSLGSILYELLTGVPPFEPEALRKAGCVEIQRILREEEPSRPSTRVTQPGGKPAEGTNRKGGSDTRTLARQLRGELDWISLKAMSKDRTRRYGTADALAQDVQRYLRDEPVQAGPPSAIYQLRKLARRHRMALALAAAVLSGILGITVVTAIQARRVAAERDRANDEAETATQVAGFLQDLFRASDPSEAQGTAITARGILDRGSRRIREDLEGQPTVQARLMAVMGQVYRQMGLAEDAEPLAREAVEIARTSPDVEPAALARYLINLAWIRRDRGDYEAAVEATREAVVIAEGTDDLELLSVALNDHGSMLRSFRDLDSARQSFERALTYREQIYGPEHLHVGGTLYQLGWLYHLLDEDDRALETYDRACKILVRELGPDHADVAWCFGDRSTVLADVGRFEASIRDLERAIEIRERILPPDHPDLATSVASLGHLHTQQGDLARAVEYMEEALAMRSRSLGPDHVEVAKVHDYLGWIHDKLGDTDAAERHYRLFLEILDRSPQAAQPVHAAALYNVAAFYSRHDRRRDAERLLRQALEIYESTVGTSDPYMNRTLFLLATGLAHQRSRLEEASEILERYLAIHEQAQEPDAKRIALGRLQLGSVLVRRGRGAEAVPVLEDAARVLEGTTGIQDRRLGECLWWLARAYSQQGAVQKADPHYRRAIEIFERDPGTGEGELALKLAVYHAERGEQEVAIQHLRDAAERGRDVSDLWMYPRLEELRNAPGFRDITALPR